MSASLVTVIGLGPMGRAMTHSLLAARRRLIILSLTDYQAMWDILRGTTGSLSGRTVANLSSDTPDVTRRASTWARSHGASSLAGGVMVPAPMVGTDRSYVCYSGDRNAFEAHRSVLAHISTSS